MNRPFLCTEHTVQKAFPVCRASIAASYAAFLERRRLHVLLFLALLQSLRGIGAESDKPALIRGKREMQPYSPRPDPKDQFHLRARLHALCRMVFVFQVLAHISAVRKPCLIKIPLCPANLSAEQESKARLHNDTRIQTRGKLRELQSLRLFLSTDEQRESARRTVKPTGKHKERQHGPACIWTRRAVPLCKHGNILRDRPFGGYHGTAVNAALQQRNRLNVKLLHRKPHDAAQAAGVCSGAASADVSGVAVISGVAVAAGVGVVLTTGAF